MNLIILDIDDTITKSENQHQTAFVRAMTSLGITNINKNWKGYRHHTDSFILKENYETNLNREFDFKEIAAFENTMSSFMSKLSPVEEITGAKSTIESLMQNEKYAFCFATGSLLKPALMKLRQAQIPFKHHQVTSSNGTFDREGIVRKAIFKSQQEYGQENFDHIIAVGDGIWDLKAARNLGLHFIGIGAKNIHDFSNENVALHINDWNHFDLRQMENTFDIIC